MATGGKLRAVIIGAGLGGLSAGLSLKARGWDVLVLERENAPGGRCRTESSDGFLFDTGAQYFHDSFDEFLTIAVGEGLGETMRLPEAGKGIFHGGRVAGFLPRSANPRSLLPWQALGSAALLDVPTLALELAADYRRYNVRFPEWWTPHDSETADRFLARRTTRLFRRAVAEPLALYWCGAGLDELSAPAFMVGLRFMLGDRTGCLTGGMGSVAAAMSGRLKLMTGMEAREIIVEGRRAVGVRAVPVSGGRARSYRADFVVCAVPAPAVPGLARGLGRLAAIAIRETKYSPCITVNLAFSSEVSGPAGPVLLPGDEGFGAAWACTNASKALEHAPERSSVVTLIFSGRRAGALLEEEASTIVDVASADASRLYELKGLEPAACVVTRHPVGLPVVRPGHAARCGALHRSGSGIRALALAGDWTVSPTVEGAIASGVIAAGEAP